MEIRAHPWYPRLNISIVLAQILLALRGLIRDNSRMTPSPKLRVVQCWDDGVDDDIRLIEILRRHNARASFNLNAGTHGPERGAPHLYKGIKEVRRLARPELVSVYEGFTIANHSLTHPHLPQLEPEAFTYEIVEGRKQLQDIFGQPILGFVYPYGDRSPEVGEAIKAAGHIYARGVVSEEAAYPPADPFAFQPNAKFDHPDFWARYETAKKHGSVFYFWGHSYELVTDADWEGIERLIERISADPDSVWEDLPNLFSEGRAGF